VSLVVGPRYEADPDQVARRNQRKKLSWLEIDEVIEQQRDYPPQQDEAETEAAAAPSASSSSSSSQSTGYAQWLVNAVVDNV
jgi:hypothetical protein